jgi:hypothetical protein
MELRGRVLVLGNQIHLINNISTISVSNLSYERDIPKEAWWCLGGTVFAFLVLPDWWKFVAFLAVAGTGGFIWLQYKNRHVDSYALSILMNAGNRTLLFSQYNSFLKGVAVELCNAINAPADRSLTVNLDQRQIFDNIRNSAISVGDVSGDIVNNV